MIFKIKQSDGSESPSPMDLHLSQTQKLSSERFRDFCARCLRAKITCYCGEVQSFQISIQIVILQHPLERSKSIGTARMTHHCIKNSKLIIATEFDNHDQVNQLILDPNNRCMVLYPGDHSQNISQFSEKEIAAEYPALDQLVIFVIDGTWACAKRMLKRSQTLAQLPQICFTPKIESQYKIRQQPSKNCLSTIEAVHQLIEIFTPTQDASALLTIFQSMVNRQIDYSKKGILARQLK